MVRFTFSPLLVLSLACLSVSKPLGEQLSLEANEPIHTTEGWSYVNCGNPTDPIQIMSISVSPDPPQPGKDLTVKVEAIATRVINEGAYADVTVKLGLIKILTKSFDVCEEARTANATVQCPVQPDTYNIEQTVALPREIPRAKFTVNVRGYTDEDDDMLCLNLHVDFMKKPFFKLGW